MTLFGKLPWALGPVAHRGLHVASRGIIENTASAFEAAIAKNYAVECDVQAALGDEPVIFHDAGLERLTEGKGRLSLFSHDALRDVVFRGTSDRIMRLGEFLELIGGRVPIYLEIKTSGDGAPGLTRNIANVLSSYKGPLAAMSFDPKTVAHIRRLLPRLPRGTVSMVHTPKDYPELSSAARFRLTHLLDFPATRPNFVAYHVNDLPQPGVSALRALGMPVLTWTVRTEEQREKAKAYADTIIFEELAP
jgi:glycerophosphoryl diester phosphodiesterase